MDKNPYEKDACPMEDDDFPRPSRFTSFRPDVRLISGAQVGHFVIERRLGRGGMGVVYLAHDTRLHRQVALKSLPSEVIGNPAVRTRLKREARLLAQLNDPNIATIHDEFETKDDQFFLVLEYVPGRTLADLISDRRLTVPDALSIGIQMAQALNAAHTKGVIHRDLKPSNVMITPEGHVKVLDFGLGKAVETDRHTPGEMLSKPGRMMGTLEYMSPEMAAGDEADHKADIWSFGVVMYEMLVGSVPFRGKDQQAVIRAILNQEPRLPQEPARDIPRLLWQTILKMLQKRPSERFETMAVVVYELHLMKQNYMRLSSPRERTPSIAVLPFADMSPHQDQEYFCDGMAEELINALTQIRDLKVIARTSAFSYKNKSVNVCEIGRELDVESILEGSVRTADDRLRITVQLVDTAQGHHLWSERYDRRIGDVFSIQDNITTAIIDRLKPRLLNREKAGLSQRTPVDIDAYHLYLKGRYFSSKGSPGALDAAFKY